MDKVLVTGGTGFVGSFVTTALRQAGVNYCTAGRRDADVLIPAITGDTDWYEALQGVTQVIHLAGRAHVLEESAADPLAAFRAVNTAGTRALATQAAAAGVRRLVFMSTLKVNGEGRQTPYTASDIPAPHGPYAHSKAEAEAGLWDIARTTGMEIVVIRPPLVYGPGVKANFLSLLKSVDRGWPLPLGRANNRRSLIYGANLADAVRVCLHHPQAAGKTFLVSDGPAMGLADVIKAMATALQRPLRLIPVPIGIMRVAAGLLGKAEAVDKLLGSLTLDDSAIRQCLGWQPPFTLEMGLRATAAWWKAAR